MKKKSEDTSTEEQYAEEADLPSLQPCQIDRPSTPLQHISTVQNTNEEKQMETQPGGSQDVPMASKWNKSIKFVSSFHIFESPIPVISKKKSNRRKKSSQSKIITSSLCKNGLEQSLNLATKTAVIKRKLLPKSRKPRKLAKKEQFDKEEESEEENGNFGPADEDMDVDEVGQIPSDNKDTVCLFCDTRFSKYNEGNFGFLAL